MVDVETCRFFPSGIVVLSGGADMRLKIWSAQDGTCPRTLIGHTGGQGAQYSQGQSAVIRCIFLHRHH